MKLKIFFLMIIAVGIGFLLSNLMYRSYDESLSVLKQNKEYYFLTYGSYDSLDEAIKNCNVFPNYAYEQIDGKIKVYIAITSVEENIEKIKGLYPNEANNISVEMKSIPTNAFTEILSQYDELFKATIDKQSLETIIKQVLEKYKEL